MNLHTANRILISTTAAVICISATWVTAPAQAKTDVTGGGGDATFGISEIDQAVAARRAQMANDYVANAAARAAYVVGAR
jgi:hypothetical protein